MNLNKLVINLLFLLSLAFTHVNAQKYPQVAIYQADTVIIFDIAQGKKLAIYNEQRKYLEKENKELNAKINTLDTLVKLQDEKINNYVQIEKRYVSIVDQKQKQIETTQSQIDIYKREAKRQKNQKRLTIGVGVILTSALSYLYITK